MNHSSLPLDLSPLLPSEVRTHAWLQRSPIISPRIHLASTGDAHWSLAAPRCSTPKSTPSRIGYPLSPDPPRWCPPTLASAGPAGVPNLAQKPSQAAGQRKIGTAQHLGRKTLRRELNRASAESIRRAIAVVHSELRDFVFSSCRLPCD